MRPKLNARQAFALFKSMTQAALRDLHCLTHDINWVLDPKLDACAQVSHDVYARTVTITFNPTEHASKTDIKQSAIHEALHVLLAEFSARAHCRFVDRKELSAAEEALVQRLTRLLYPSEFPV